MTAKARIDVQVEIKKATNYIFGPLIDSQTSHPDTVLTALNLIEKFVQTHGKMYPHVVADLHLCKFPLQIKWSNPMRWNRLIIRHGGMHTLMSFIGCVGNLMKGTGLEEILNSPFSGVASMLNGKAWTMAVRGFRNLAQ